MTNRNHAIPTVLLLVLGLGLGACGNRGNDEAGPAPIDTGAQSGVADTALTRGGEDTSPVPAGPDTSMATPPITPPPAQARDTAGASGPAQPGGQAAPGAGGKASRVEYEGWRQYSVNCARCHGQDVLPNPVAANLLISLGAGGPTDSPEEFMQVVSEGRPARGMPAFKGLLSPDQIQAIYAYVKGRADDRIPPGRPKRPEA